MRIEVKQPGDLDAADLNAWRAMLGGSEALASPYYTPEFVQAAASARPNTRVALIRDGSALAGVFPFERGALGFCRPAGGAMSDFNGVIAAPDAALDMTRIAAACGVRVYGYDNLPEDQARHGFSGAPDGGCAVIGLEDGFEAWREARGKETKSFKTLDRYRRNLARDHGEIRVVIDETNDAVFDTLCEWKRAQLQAAGYFDIFAARSTRALLERVRAARGPGLRGLLSALYAGDRLAAVHFGMQAGSVLHYWFPGYDPDFGKYSAGALLLDDLARAGAEHGWASIHLGKGDYRYKRQFSSRAIPLMAGVLRTPSLAAAAHRAAWLARDAAESAPLGPVSHWPGKALRKAARIADFGWAAA